MFREQGARPIVDAMDERRDYQIRQIKAEQEGLREAMRPVVAWHASTLPTYTLSANGQLDVAMPQMPENLKAWVDYHHQRFQERCAAIMRGHSPMLG